MEEDLTLNHYSFIDLKNEYNTEEVMHTFNKFFFAFGRFPAINDLVIIPTGEVPSFFNSSNFISPSEQYKKVNSGGKRGLVCVQFLDVVNIYLGGDKTISKEAMNKFFNNLSMRDVTINRLNKSINSFLVNKTLAYENVEIERLQISLILVPLLATSGLLIIKLKVQL